MEEIKLTDAQLEAALRCCAKSEASACKKCPIGIREDDGKWCFDTLPLMAAKRLEELSGYEGKLILAQNELLELREKKGEPDG